MPDFYGNPNVGEGLMGLAKLQAAQESARVEPMMNALRMQQAQLANQKAAYEMGRNPIEDAQKDWLSGKQRDEYADSLSQKKAMEDFVQAYRASGDLKTAMSAVPGLRLSVDQVRFLEEEDFKKKERDRKIADIERQRAAVGNMAEGMVPIPNAPTVNVDGGQMVPLDTLRGGATQARYDINVKDARAVADAYPDETAKSYYNRQDQAAKDSALLERTKALNLGKSEIAKNKAENAAATGQGSSAYERSRNNVEAYERMQAMKTAGDMEGAAAVQSWLDYRTGGQVYGLNSYAADVGAVRMKTMTQTGALAEEGGLNRKEVARQTSELNVLGKRMRPITIIDPATGQPMTAYVDIASLDGGNSQGGNNDPLIKPIAPKAALKPIPPAAATALSSFRTIDRDLDIIEKGLHKAGRFEGNIAKAKAWIGADPEAAAVLAAIARARLDAQSIIKGIPSDRDQALLDATMVDLGEPVSTGLEKVKQARDTLRKLSGVAIQQYGGAKGYDMPQDFVEFGKNIRPDMSPSTPPAAPPPGAGKGVTIRRLP